MNQDFTDFVCSKLDELKELFLKKNAQYKTAEDPLSNFRAGALLNCGRDDYRAMYNEAKSYQRKHIVHIARHGIDADKGDESLGDIIVYCAIMLYMRTKWEEINGNK